MIKLECYNENSAKNANLVVIKEVVFYFSYETCIAIDYNQGLFVRENDRGPTTGKHMTWIDSGAKEDRLPYEEFQKHYDAACKQIGL